MDGMLSQEEINALLNGMNMEDSDVQNEFLQEERLTEQEKDAIGEISNISMGTAATTLSTLVNRKVVITTPVVSCSNLEKLAEAYDLPCVFIEILYKEGLEGNNILSLKQDDVKIITDLMMGGDGTNQSEELSDMHLSAICEAMNQMMGSSSTSLSSMINKKVDISPPKTSIVDFGDSLDVSGYADVLEGEFIKVSFKMVIEGLVDSEIMYLYPVEFAKDLYYKFIHSSDEVKEVKQQPKQQIQEKYEPSYTAPKSFMEEKTTVDQKNQNVTVKPAQFAPFQDSYSTAGIPENIGLIKDVPLEVTVELGRTTKSIKEILEFAPGTIIELNKLAGEPIDVLVNGKHVAKGEVVVIEESFGIRVTEIIK